LKDLAFNLMSNPTGQVAFNKLKEQFRLGSVNTVKSYIEYLEDGWLIFTMNVYTYSVKRQQIAAKKAYSIDTGRVNAIGFSFVANTGKLMENAAFLALRRKTHEIYYYTTPAGYDVDFYLPESGQLVELTQSMDNPATREREIRALAEAMNALGISSGLILADSNSETITRVGSTITIRSLAEWLLESK